MTQPSAEVLGGAVGGRPGEDGGRGGTRRKIPGEVQRDHVTRASPQ